MLTSSNLYKLNKDGQIKRLNTDDIPEGEFNKYSLNYVDGKSVGDIVLRNDPTEKLAHALLDGRRIYSHQSKLFYEWANNCKNLAISGDIRYDFFNKSEKDYDDFLNNNIFENTQEKYCPYYVVGTEDYSVFQVTDDEGRIGYTPIHGEIDTELQSGYVYADNTLSEVISISSENWFYNGAYENSSLNYVRIPTYPTYNNGNIKSYYFIVIDSRADDDTTSIRSVQIGMTATLENQPAYVTNSGTAQHLILDFGIPKGNSATIQIGDVKDSENARVENVGTINDAIFNFDLPRGKQGPAGGVVTLHYIAKGTPTNVANQNEKYYDLENNKIYIYKDGYWLDYSDADEGVIYIKDVIVYHYNGTNLIEFSNVVYVDNETINKSNDGTLTAIGVKSKNKGVFYDWIGTLEEWKLGRDDGTIEDNWICFITDDEIL